MQTLNPRSLAGIGAILITLSGLQLLAMMLLTGKVVSEADIPVTGFLPLFEVLWQQNPVQTLQALAHQGLFTLAHRDTDMNLRLWSLDFYLSSLLCHALATWLSWRWWRLAPPLRLSRLPLAVAAVALTLLPGLYLTIAAHCAEPTWLPVVILRGLQSPGGAGWQFLGDLPVAPAAFIDAARLACLLAGLGFWWLTLRGKKKGPPDGGPAWS